MRSWLTIWVLMLVPLASLAQVVSTKKIPLKVPTQTDQTEKTTPPPACEGEQTPTGSFCKYPQPKKKKCANDTYLCLNLKDLP